MSIEPEAKEVSRTSLPVESLDLTGLPAPVAYDLRKLVATLRDSLGLVGRAGPLEQEPPEEWAHRLQVWVDSHPARSITIDDSRETLYADRGG